MPIYDEMVEDRKVAADAQDTAHLIDTATDALDYEQQYQQYVQQFLALDPRCVHCGEPIQSVREAHVTPDSKLAHVPGRCRRDPSRFFIHHPVPFHD